MTYSQDFALSYVEDKFMCSHYAGEIRLKLLKLIAVSSLEIKAGREQSQKMKREQAVRCHCALNISFV